MNVYVYRMDIAVYVYVVRVRPEVKSLSQAVAAAVRGGDRARAERLLGDIIRSSWHPGVNGGTFLYNVYVCIYIYLFLYIHIYIYIRAYTHVSLLLLIVKDAMPC